jgi:hypothetical protein
MERCRNAIREEHKRFIMQSLDQMSYLPPSNRAVTHLLQEIVRPSLCVRAHQNQAETVVIQWQNKIHRLALEERNGQSTPRSLSREQSLESPARERKDISSAPHRDVNFERIEELEQQLLDMKELVAQLQDELTLYRSPRADPPSSPLLASPTMENDRKDLDSNNQAGDQDLRRAQPIYQLHLRNDEPSTASSAFKSDLLSEAFFLLVLEETIKLRDTYSSSEVHNIETASTADNLPLLSGIEAFPSLNVSLVPSEISTERSPLRQASIVQAQHPTRSRLRQIGSAPTAYTIPNLQISPQHLSFNPFSSNKWPRQITNDIHKRMTQPLGTKSMTTGFNYILSSSSSAPGYLKIGYTARPIDLRRNELEHICGIELKEVRDEHQRRVMHSYIVEQLSHIELSNYRRTYECSCCTVHKEWFEIDESRALEAVERWRRWVGDALDSQGKLKPYWAEKVRLLCMGIPVVDWKCWTQPAAALPLKVVETRPMGQRVPIEVSA